MKPLSLTALTLAGYLFFANIFTPAGVFPFQNLAVFPMQPNPEGGAPARARKIETGENVPVSYGVTSPVLDTPVLPASPELDTFAKSVENGNPAQVVGVFVPGEFALPVVQQPSGQSNYVDTTDGTVTQFATAGSYGSIGLLAHNYLSGRLFSNLSSGQDVVVVYGDGQETLYRISTSQRYQALDSTNPYSYFVDVNDPTHASITAGTLFMRVYAHKDQLVFQTCIAANGDSSWGRLFVTAEKVK